MVIINFHLNIHLLMNNLHFSIKVHWIEVLRYCPLTSTVWTPFFLFYNLLFLVFFNNFMIHLYIYSLLPSLNKKLVFTFLLTIIMSQSNISYFIVTAYALYHLLLTSRCSKRIFQVCMMPACAFELDCLVRHSLYDLIIPYTHCISLIRQNLTEMRACECKKIVCMHVSMHIWLHACAQI